MIARYVILEKEIPLIILALFFQEAYANEDLVLDTTIAETNRIRDFLQTQEKPAYWIGVGIHEIPNFLPHPMS